jgi:hypothetical protein
LDRSEALARLLAETVQRRLGRNYDVVLEYLGQPREHLHVEFDPKRLGVKRSKSGVGG